MSRKTVPRRRQTKSTTRIVTDAEARELADQWGLSGKARDAFVSWLPTITERRRGVEAGLKTLPTPKQVRKELAALERHLKVIKQVGRHCRGALVAEVIGPIAQAQPYDAAAVCQASGRVGRWMRELDDCVLPATQTGLRRLDQQIASDKAQSELRRHQLVRDRLFPESLPGYQMRRTGSRARPQDWLLAESALDFHASWLSRTKLGREAFACEVLARAGIADGTIETLVMQVASHRSATKRNSRAKEPSISS